MIVAIRGLALHLKTTKTNNKTNQEIKVHKRHITMHAYMQ